MSEGTSKQLNPPQWDKVDSGVPVPDITKITSSGTIPESAHKSLEELRLEDYSAGRTQKSCPVNSSNGCTTTSPFSHAPFQFSSNVACLVGVFDSNGVEKYTSECTPLYGSKVGGMVDSVLAKASLGTQDAGHPVRMRSDKWNCMLNVNREEAVRAGAVYSVHLPPDPPQPSNVTAGTGLAPVGEWGGNWTNFLRAIGLLLFFTVYSQKSTPTSVKVELSLANQANQELRARVHYLESTHRELEEELRSSDLLCLEQHRGAGGGPLPVDGLELVPAELVNRTVHGGCNSPDLKEIVHAHLNQGGLASTRRGIKIAAEKKFGGVFNVFCWRQSTDLFYSNRLELSLDHHGDVYCSATEDHGFYGCIAYRQKPCPYATTEQ